MNSRPNEATEKKEKKREKNCSEVISETFSSLESEDVYIGINSDTLFYRPIK